MSEVMDIEKAHVGRVIGKGGETIRDIQQRSRVCMGIDCACPWCLLYVVDDNNDPKN